MTLKKWSFLFYTTLLAGVIGAVASGLIVGQAVFKYGIGEVSFGMIGVIIMGLMVSVVSQMGFFAYLMVNYMALSFFRNNVRLWEGIQIILIAFAFFDFVYLRHDIFAKNAPIMDYVWFPLGIIVYALFVAFWKVRATNRAAWVPTVFFMFVVTIIEWLPALQENKFDSMIMMLIPLLLCNTWQIMQLHKLVKK